MSSNDVRVALHGAWAEGSSWATVIEPSAADGVEATSSSDDVAALEGSRPGRSSSWRHKTA